MAKYSTEGNKDDIRKDLIDFANSNQSSYSNTFQYNSKFLDVTGSLGCWGIVQVDNKGNMKH